MTQRSSSAKGNPLLSGKFASWIKNPFDFSGDRSTHRWVYTGLWAEGRWGETTQGDVDTPCVHDYTLVNYLPG